MTDHISPFEQIRHETPDGEYWSARELSELLGYTQYARFVRVVRKAELSCAKSGQRVEDHFDHVIKMVSIGSGARRQVPDVHLSRYACYLAVENADPDKEIVALGQSYFAVQTHRAQLTERLAGMSEDDRRLFFRDQLSERNRLLTAAAMGAGVVHPLDFAVFQDHGYMGLYNGERRQDIAARKGLAAGEAILDYMGSEELIDNAFRATQATSKIIREGITGTEAANQAHYEVGRKVRQTIADLGGTMPEDLPTPSESIKQLRKQERKRLRRGPQLPLFDQNEEPPSSD